MFATLKDLKCANVLLAMASNEPNISHCYNHSHCKPFRDPGQLVTGPGSFSNQILLRVVICGSTRTELGCCVLGTVQFTCVHVNLANL